MGTAMTKRIYEQDKPIQLTLRMSAVVRVPLDKNSQLCRTARLKLKHRAQPFIGSSAGAPTLSGWFVLVLLICAVRWFRARLEVTDQPCIPGATVESLPLCTPKLNRKDCNLNVLSDSRTIKAFFLGTGKSNEEKKPVWRPFMCKEYTWHFSFFIGWIP